MPTAPLLQPSKRLDPIDEVPASSSSSSSSSSFQMEVEPDNPHGIICKEGDVVIMPDGKPSTFGLSPRLKWTHWKNGETLKLVDENQLNENGELKAELKSAKKLSDDEISKITDELTKNFSSKIRLNYKHDESLIGGLVLQVGSTMVDTSIKNKLQSIENRMREA